MTPETPKRSAEAVARELARKDRRIRELEEELARLRASALLAQ